MGDMSQVIIPRSDQINADDLIAGPRTIRISGVRVTPGTEQPVNITIEGEKRVYRPCKSMCRVLVAGWGPDSSQYVGRSLTLFHDPEVVWGGMKVGGIRISHMSHIERPMMMALSASKTKRVMAQILPLREEKARQTSKQDHPRQSRSGGAAPAPDDALPQNDDAPEASSALDARAFYRDLKAKLTTCQDIDTLEMAVEMHADDFDKLDAKQHEACTALIEQHRARLAEDVA